MYPLSIRVYALSLEMRGGLLHKQILTANTPTGVTSVAYSATSYSTFPNWFWGMVHLVGPCPELREQQHN